jgi:hypothetical protein
MSSPSLTSFWQRMQQIPRYYIYLLLAAVVIWQLVFPVPLPVVPSAATSGVESAVAAVPDDKLVVISTDWDASTQAETGPQTAAIIEACFRHHKKFVLLTLAPPMGAKLSQQIAVGIASRYRAEYGVAWANWGYKVGTSNVLLAMVKDIPRAMGVDFYGRPVTQLPIMRGVRSIKDIGLVVEVTGLAGMTEMWIGLVQGPYQVPFAAGYTAVMAPGYYPFMDSGQIQGMLVGAKGAAEMEALARRPGLGMAIMSAQSWAHLLIIGLIILGNVGYLMTRRGERRRT